MAADAEAEQCRPGALASAFRWRFGPPGLLLRDLRALSAFIVVKEIREILSLVGIDPDNHPGLTPWFLERVADVADYWLPGRHRESMQCAPLFPC